MIEKKPYLKRGTRQFLSNAQVRSQSTKPKIVDFGGNQEDVAIQTFGKPRPSAVKNDEDEQIIIKAKPTNKFSQPKPAQNSSAKKNQQEPNV